MCRAKLRRPSRPGLYRTTGFCERARPGQIDPAPLGRLFEGVTRCQNTPLSCRHVFPLRAGQRAENRLMNIGPGDAATMVIPGSHKSNFRHPQRKGSRSVNGGDRRCQSRCLNAGDALMFVDAIMHGSAERANPGQRRMALLLRPELGAFALSVQDQRSDAGAADFRSGGRSSNRSRNRSCRPARRREAERPSSKKRRTRGRFWSMPTLVAGPPAF